MKPSEMEQRLLSRFRPWELVHKGYLLNALCGAPSITIHHGGPWDTVADERQMWRRNAELQRARKAGLVRYRRSHRMWQITCGSIDNE